MTYRKVSETCTAHNIFPPVKLGKRELGSLVLKSSFCDNATGDCFNPHERKNLTGNVHAEIQLSTIQNGTRRLPTSDDICVTPITMAGAITPGLPVGQLTSWLDMHRCDMRYGIGIRPDDCQIAGSFLPEGWEPKIYHTIPGFNEEAFTLPWEKTVGKWVAVRVKEKK